VAPYWLGLIGGLYRALRDYVEDNDILREILLTCLLLEAGLLILIYVLPPLVGVLELLFPQLDVLLYLIVIIIGILLLVFLVYSALWFDEKICHCWTSVEYDRIFGAKQIRRVAELAAIKKELEDLEDRQEID
jgi:hypothetical protein